MNRWLAMWRRPRLRPGKWADGDPPTAFTEIIDPEDKTSVFNQARESFYQRVRAWVTRPGKRGSGLRLY